MHSGHKIKIREGRQLNLHIFLCSDEILMGEEDAGFDEDRIVVQPDATEDEYMGEEEAEALRAEKLAKNDSSHIDMTLILPKLSHLSKLTLVYEMADIGLDFEPRFAKFTDKDCQTLAHGI